MTSSRMFVFLLGVWVWRSGSGGLGLEGLGLEVWVWRVWVWRVWVWRSAGLGLEVWVWRSRYGSGGSGS